METKESNKHKRNSQLRFTLRSQSDSFLSTKPTKKKATNPIRTSKRNRTTSPRFQTSNEAQQHESGRRCGQARNYSSTTSPQERAKRFDQQLLRGECPYSTARIVAAGDEFRWWEQSSVRKSLSIVGLRRCFSNPDAFK